MTISFPALLSVIYPFFLCNFQECFSKCFGASFQQKYRGEDINFKNKGKFPSYILKDLVYTNLSANNFLI